VEDAVRRESPSRLLRPVDVHVHRHTRELSAKLELVPASDEREAVGEVTPIAAEYRSTSPDFGGCARIA
ncbi:MAG TPA: hypothetical protein VGQ16_02010, partial [Vicinamibacterales bacterium]|nr:hypothetical protein [Vicinamibacterales bacterium]